MNDKFTAWVIEDIKGRGWSYSELARQASVSQSLVSRTLSGDMLPSADFCIKVALALDVSPIFLLQLAGILPEDGQGPVDSESPIFQEITAILQSLPLDKRKELLRYARYLSQGE